MALARCALIAAVTMKSSAGRDERVRVPAQALAQALANLAADVRSAPLLVILLSKSVPFKIQISYGPGRNTINHQCKPSRKAACEL